MIRNLVIVCGLAVLTTVSAGSLASAKMASLDGDQVNLRVAATNRSGIDIAPRSSPAVQNPIPCGITGSDGVRGCIAVLRRS
jgi:hypothetical protein